MELQAALANPVVSVSPFESSDKEKDICVICADYKQKTINLPCIHSCLCFHCAKLIGNKPEAERKCPACRCQLETIRPYIEFRNNYRYKDDKKS